MAIELDAVMSWMERIAGLFDEAIERLWFTEGKEMRRTVLDQAPSKACSEAEDGRSAFEQQTHRIG